MERNENFRAIGSLVAARVVYAINWLNIGAIFVLMGPDLTAGVGGLGTVTSTFYLGLGLMQLPGGVLAARWGPKRVVVVGIFLSSGAALVTSVTSTIPEVAVLRFVVGTGMAFVFAPGVVLVAKMLRGEKIGMGVGLFNSAFDLGGLVGIFGWIVLATITGWRGSLALSGALGIFTGVLTSIFVPGDPDGKELKLEWTRLKSILSNRQLILVGAGALGIGVGNITISSFMGYYVVNTFGVEPSVGGAVQGLVVGVPIFTAVWGGRLYDRRPDPRKFMLASLAGTGIALGFGAYPSLYAAVACSAIGGVVSGTGYTAAFAAAKDLNPAGESYDGLAVAWVNAISLTGSFVPPLLYSYLVENSGYPLAWLGCAAVGCAFLIPAFLMEKARH